MSLVSRSSMLAGAISLAAGLLVAGCGSGDVELNGKIFDAMGVSSAKQKKSGDPKIAARTGLVVPPNTGSLPEPGSGRSVEADADLAFIDDPDRKKVVDQAELARRQAAYCKEHYELPKARGDATVDGVTGPAGPCRKSVLNAVQVNFGNSKDE